MNIVTGLALPETSLRNSASPRISVVRGSASVRPSWTVHVPSAMAMSYTTSLSPVTFHRIRASSEPALSGRNCRSIRRKTSPSTRRRRSPRMISLISLVDRPLTIRANSSGETAAKSRAASSSLTLSAMGHPSILTLK